MEARHDNQVDDRVAEVSSRDAKDTRDNLTSRAVRNDRVAKHFVRKRRKSRKHHKHRHAGSRLSARDCGGPGVGVSASKANPEVTTVRSSDPSCENTQPPRLFRIFSAHVSSSLREVLEAQPTAKSRNPQRQPITVPTLHTLRRELKWHMQRDKRKERAKKNIKDREEKKVAESGHTSSFVAQEPNAGDSTETSDKWSNKLTKSQSGGNSEERQWLRRRRSTRKHRITRYTRQLMDDNLKVTTASSNKSLSEALTSSLVRHANIRAFYNDLSVYSNDGVSKEELAFAICMMGTPMLIVLPLMAHP